MEKIIAVSNQKGGVAKTSTALAIIASLFYNKKRVLTIDLDAQGNLSATMKANQMNSTIFDVLAQRKTIGDVIQKTSFGDCLCSSPELSGADITICETGKEYRLQEAIESVKDQYDYIIIDTAPALGILTVNALVAATEIIIPSQADVYSLQGITQFNKTVSSVRRYCNQSLSIAGILLTRFNPKGVLSREVEAAMNTISQEIGTRVFKTKIRECVAVKEAQATKENIFEYAVKSNAAQDYLAFMKEYLESSYE
jgi:chromosome partitioning protein